MVRQNQLRSPESPPIASQSGMMNLPCEVQQYLYSYLPAADIAAISRTSHAQRDVVKDWLGRSVGCRNLIPPGYKDERTEEGYTTALNVCEVFGRLAKSATLLFSSDARLRLFDSWIQKLIPQLFEKSTAVDDTVGRNWKKVTSVTAYAAALHRFCRGWDEIEFGRIEALMEAKFGLSTKLTAFLQSNVGDVFDTETDLRLLLRAFYWEQLPIEKVHPESRGMWLSHLLKQVGREDGKVLFLILGPTYSGAVVDNLFTTELSRKFTHHPGWVEPATTVPVSYSEAKKQYYDLGRCLCLLKATWENTDDDDDDEEEVKKTSVQKTNSLIGHLLTIFTSANVDDTGTADVWLVDNMALCLLFSSQAIVEKYISQLPGTREVCQLLVSILIVCDRLENELSEESSVVKVLDWAICQREGQQRMAFIREFWNEIRTRLDSELRDGLPQLLTLLCLRLKEKNKTLAPPTKDLEVDA